MSIHENLIQDAIKVMPVFIAVFENNASTKEEVRKAFKGVSSLLKMIDGRNIDYLEFNAIYGRNDPNMRKKLEIKSREIFETLITMGKEDSTS